MYKGMFLNFVFSTRGVYHFGESGDAIWDWMHQSRREIAEAHAVPVSANTPTG